MNTSVLKKKSVRLFLSVLKTNISAGVSMFALKFKPATRENTLIPTKKNALLFLLASLDTISLIVSKSAALSHSATRVNISTETPKNVRRSQNAFKANNFSVGNSTSAWLFLTVHKSNTSSWKNSNALRYPIAWPAIISPSERKNVFKLFNACLQNISVRRKKNVCKSLNALKGNNTSAGQNTLVRRYRNALLVNTLILKKKNASTLLNALKATISQWRKKNVYSFLNAAATNISAWIPSYAQKFLSVLKDMNTSAGLVSSVWP